MSIEEIIEKIKSGACVVYPTSTLPALGCIPNPKSLDILYKIKERDYAKPVSIGVVNLEQASEIAEVPPDVKEIIRDFPDGSLTIILKSKTELDDRLGGRKVALRVVSNPIAKKLLNEVGPLTATSANISGQEPVNNCDEAAKILSSGPYSVVSLSGECGGGSPSTLIAWHTVCDTPSSPHIEVVREGRVSRKDVLNWWRKRI